MTAQPEAMDRLQVFALLREECRKAGGQSAWARRAELTPAYVSQVLNAQRAPGPAILAALGLRPVTRYVAITAARAFG